MQPQRFIIALLASALVTGCGIFSPRTDFENPLVDQVVSDPFSFSDLLNGSAEHFKPEQLKPDWSDLFTSNLKYTLILADKAVEYDKARFISDLTSQFNGCRTCQVAWKRDGDFPPQPNDSAIVLQSIGYSVVNPSVSGDTLFAGSCSFVIVRIDNSWCISEWTDIPTKGAFFTIAK